MEIFSSLVHHGHLPVFFYVGEVVVLILASAICSGLNIALMSLDLSDLERKAKLGNHQARSVLPLRRRTHLALVSILLTNVAAVSATTLVLHQRLNGYVAGILATLLIVIFGEILPQAIFSKNPLSWTSRFAPFLKTIVAITFILSHPLEILLNRLLPDQKAVLQSRHELGLVITEHLTNVSSELDENEIMLMRGALSLSEKRTRDIMTDIKKTYWVTPATLLDADKIDEIKAKGYSRIPVFDDLLTKCYGILLMKDLVDIDFDDNKYRVEDMDLYPSQLVGGMTALDTLLRKFIGSGSHLVPVEKDDQIVGIVTIEDLIEEIVGLEIEDETDRIKRSGNA